MNDNYEIVQHLLKNNDIDVNKPKRSFPINNPYQRIHKKIIPPLIIAIKKNNINIVQLLLSHPKINVNAKYKNYDEKNDERTISYALIIAVENFNMVKLLLEHSNINPYCKYENKISYGSSYVVKTALCVAIERKYIDIIKLLVSKFDYSNTDQFVEIAYPYEQWEDPTSKTIKAALIIAIEKGDLDIINLLLSSSINMKNQNYIYIEYMSEMSSYAEYKFAGGFEYILPLIKRVLHSPDEYFHLQLEECTPALCYAINRNLHEIVNILLSSDKIDVNSQISKSSSSYKTDENDENDMDLWKWSSIIDTTIPALCLAIEQNDEETVKLLLLNPKIDVNANCIKRSCEYKENNEEEENNSDDNENKWVYYTKIDSPLHIAVKKQNIEFIKMLLQNNKINLNAVDNTNKTAIYYANDDKIKQLFNDIK